MKNEFFIKQGLNVCFALVSCILGLVVYIRDSDITALHNITGRHEATIERFNLLAGTRGERLVTVETTLIEIRDTIKEMKVNAERRENKLDEIIIAFHKKR